MLSGTKGRSRLQDLHWINNTRIAFLDNHQAGVDAYSLWAINVDGTKPKELVEGKW